MAQDMNISSLASRQEKEARRKAFELFQANPLPESEKMAHAGLFLQRQELAKILFFNDLYQKITDRHGVIMEFGVRWGRNLVTLANLRGIHEPYNYNRRIIGFDTFEGFVNTGEKDGKGEGIKEGAFSVTPGYEGFLESLMTYHESESPLNHIGKFELIKGDASQSLKAYLDRHPETIIAFAYFDLDIFQPTRDCLKMIRDHLPKGAILGFDELNDPKFPGETLALREVFEIKDLQIRRSSYSAMQSYVILD